MTSDKSSDPHAARKTWLAVLARASLDQLKDFLPRVQPMLALHPVRPPEVGMLMLRGRIGGTGNPFNLGEASVVRCAVRLGEGPLGVSYALGRDKRRAELAALFDAMLQDPQHFEELRRGLIAPLALAQSQARAQTQRDVAASKVEFFTFVRGEA